MLICEIRGYLMMGGNQMRCTAMIQAVMTHWQVAANVRQTLGPLKCPKVWPNTSGKLEHIFQIKRHL